MKAKVKIKKGSGIYWTWHAAWPIEIENTRGLFNKYVLHSPQFPDEDSCRRAVNKFLDKMGLEEEKNDD